MLSFRLKLLIIKYLLCVLIYKKSRINLHEKPISIFPLPFPIQDSMQFKRYSFYVFVFFRVPVQHNQTALIRYREIKILYFAMPCIPSSFSHKGVTFSKWNYTTFKENYQKEKNTNALCCCCWSLDALLLQLLESLKK